MPRGLGPALIAITAIGFALRSWLKWPDIHIDFGQQLYLAWQMTEGRLPYRDLVYNYGPLSPLLNWAAFEVLGVSVLSLATANLVALGGITALLYALLRRAGDRLSATIAGLAFVAMFAFCQLTDYANYNYATPYENSLTLGLLAALGALACAERCAETGRATAAGGAGFCVGLAFLTKPEIVLAAVAGVGAMLAMAPRARTLRVAGAALGLAAAPPLLAIVALATAMPLRDAVAGTFGSWATIAGSQTADNLFYRRGMGTDDLPGNLGAMLAVLGGYVALFVPSLLLASRLRPGRTATTIAGVVFVALSAVGVFVVDESVLYSFGRPLPLLLAGAAALILLGRHRGDAGDDTRAIRLGLLAFALALLLKMLFHARIQHYGFVLLMPATLLAALATIHWIPSWIARRGGAGIVFTATALAALVTLGSKCWDISGRAFAEKTRVVSSGADTILADARGPFFANALQVIAENTSAEQTVAVFPEGAILNFLGRRANPTPSYNFMPTTLAAFGEARTLAELQRDPPELILYVEKDSSEFGARYFGTDYARDLAAWIERSYDRLARIGNEPLRNGRFGILVWRRKRD